ncbi:MAG: YihY/virulence factor BrkB family protein [Chitinispirillaceae bacterium]
MTGNRFLGNIIHNPAATVKNLQYEKNCLRRWLVHALVFVRIVISEYTLNHCISRASGIAFVLLLTFIPLITTTALMMASIMEVQPDHVERALSALLPFAPPAVMQHIVTFFMNAQKLRGIGIGVLVVTTMGLFGTVEQSLNVIWKVLRNRSFFHRLRTFTMVIVYSPILFFASFQFRRSGIFGLLPGEFLTSGFLPFMFTTLAFTLMIWFIPNTKVKFRSAFLGGLVACLLFELERKSFGHYVQFSFQTKTIYGTFGLLPFFLLSLYFSAMFFLFGTQTAYVHQNFRPLLRSKKRRDRRVGDYRNYITLRMIIDCVRAFIRKQPPPTLHYFCRTYELTQPQAMGILNWLIHEKFLHQVNQSDSFVPARDFSFVPVGVVYAAIENQNRRISESPQDYTREFLSRFIKKRSELQGDEELTFIELVDILDSGERKAERVEEVLA